MMTDAEIIGYRHPTTTGRGCLCGCHRVIGLRGNLVEAYPDEHGEPHPCDWLPGFGLGYYAFVLPCPAGGPLSVVVVCHDRILICDRCERPGAPWAAETLGGSCDCPAGPIDAVPASHTVHHLFVNLTDQPPEEHMMPAATATKKSVASTVVAEVASLAGTTLALEDLRERVDKVMVDHPDVATVRFTPSGKKGAGFLEALDVADHVLCKIHVKASGEVDVKVDNQADDAPVAEVTDAMIAGAIADANERHGVTGLKIGDAEISNDELRAAHPAPTSDAVKAATNLVHGDTSGEARAIGSFPLRELLESLAGVGSKMVDAILADYPVGVGDARPTTEQVDRYRHPKKGLAKKALALWILTGDGVVQQAARERAKAPVRPAADKSRAPRSPRSPKAATGAQSAPRTTARKQGKYPEEITDAVRRAKAARGTTAGAPGAKQHVLTRKTIADGDLPLGPPPAKGAAAPARLVDEHGSVDPAAVTVDRILLAAGGVSAKRLRDIASGAAPKEHVKVLQPLGRAIPDPFCSGRNLASMLVAWCEQIGARAAEVK